MSNVALWQQSDRRQHLRKDVTMNLKRIFFDCIGQLESIIGFTRTRLLYIELCVIARKLSKLHCDTTIQDSCILQLIQFTRVGTQKVLKKHLKESHSVVIFSIFYWILPQWETTLGAHKIGITHGCLGSAKTLSRFCNGPQQTSHCSASRWCRCEHDNTQRMDVAPRWFAGSFSTM